MRRDSSWDFYLAFAASPGYNDNVMLGVERQLLGSCLSAVALAPRICPALPILGYSMTWTGGRAESPVREMTRCAEHRNLSNYAGAHGSNNHIRVKEEAIAEMTTTSSKPPALDG
ncbi:uncharacterized protein LACBIDRAFT_331671 [Laccaria bicolor S238N-H82]|uniref:Predicted protein n=1 Tax=Laccaria bicolor (strain S238N-H82 / ATCC MYA-4686) TaxID=486041 RepID=B0DQ70_LACBS|nr:uncharacterized protein LACBIDRAFT_331671 [Laccaria bicolor S238N-H82]EDR03241.1 predicted protein [Laccaria bicolor S238N-H82]|eukprot:XP_001886037.1 predicted protein [Laccaria bicolor S238N-H82]